MAAEGSQAFSLSLLPAEVRALFVCCGERALQYPCWQSLLIFTAVVPGYFADVCQAKGQESVDASESQVLLAGEPLFAAVMGAVLLGESLGTFGYVGGAGLVAGAILAGFDEGGETETKAT